MQRHHHMGESVLMLWKQKALPETDYWGQVVFEAHRVLTIPSHLAHHPNQTNCCIHEWWAFQRREQTGMHPLETDGLSVSQLLLVVRARLALVLMEMTTLVPQVVVEGPMNEMSLPDQRSQGS